MASAYDRPYCLLYSKGTARYVAGDIVHSWQLSDVPRGADPVISMVPYSQMRERGYVCHDGNEPIITLVPTEQHDIDLDALLAAQAAVTIVGEPVHTPGDEEFAETIGRVIDEEIRRGEGSNFLIARRCNVTIG